MSLRNPDASAPVPAPWPDRASGTGSRPAARAVALALLGAMAAMLLAAWAVPPALDWGRFRTGIASIAAAQLGRRVVISGEVTLRLLPEAVLTATGVILPDQGDGVSVELSALRLQVAVLPLLAGRIRPRDLVLGTPIVRLPWPLPDSLVHPARGPVPHAFSARIENGTLRIGRAEVTGINAGIHDGPEPVSRPGLLPEANAAGFGAEGFAAFAGRSWRFTGALGIPDADGVSALDLAVRGQGAAARTNGTVQGTMADGVVQGRVRAGGPDLSLLLPAAPLAWTVDAPFVASGQSVEAASIGVSLGGSPAEASLHLQVAAPVRFDGRVHAASLDLDSWVRVLAAGETAGSDDRPSLARLAGRLDVTADTARLMGGSVIGLHGSLVSDGASLTLDHATGTLPGQARVDISGTVTRSAGLLRITGPGRLDAPDLASTLRWVRDLSPALVDALPARLLRHASLTGIVTAGAGFLSASDIAGQIDETGIAGGLGVGLRPRPGLHVDLTLDRPRLDDWLGRAWPSSGVIAQTGRRWSRFDGDVHLRAAEGSLHGTALHDLVFDARGSAAGLKVDRIAAEASGVHLSAAGMAGVDGTLSDCTLSAVTEEASGLLDVLPPSWRRTAGLWHGPASMEAALAGPPGAVAAQLRADIGDLVAEAEWHADIDSRTAAGSVTLRHPGAPRLLAQLGVAGAEQWLGTGSVALRGQVSARPGRVSVQDFDLIAADLRLGGRLDLDVTDGRPSVRGVIDAGRLALPGWTTLSHLDPAWLNGWASQLHLTAEEVTVGHLPAARSVVADFALGSGVSLLDVARASVAGGSLVAQIALDAGQALPVVAVRGQVDAMHVSGPVAGWPIDLAAGEADMDVHIDAGMTGDGLALDRASGQAVLTLRDARLTGLDLAAARQAEALTGPLSRSALHSALSQGESDGLAGVAVIDVDHGRLQVPATTLTSNDGSILVQGTADRTGLGLQFDLGASRASVGQAGPWNAIRATVSLGAAAEQLRPKRKRR